MSQVKLAGIRCVVLDLDDTLYLERDFAFSGFEAVGAWLRARMTCPWDPARRLRELFQTGNRRQLFDILLAELGCPDAAAMVPEMVACYRTHAPQIELLPDARRALERWRRPEFFLALITDGPVETQSRKISALGIRNRLDLAVLTDEWGAEFRKPHPRAFELVEQTSGRQGAACVYIADNPMKDFVVPRQRGWRSIQITRTEGVYRGIPGVAEGRPEQVVNSLDQVDLTT